MKNFELTSGRASSYLWLAAGSVALGSLARQNRQLKHSLDKAYELCNLDPLTGLSNLRGLEKAFKELAESPNRRLSDTDASTPNSLIVMDLDNFKKANDSFGHNKGDKILKSTGKIAASYVREHDLVARPGGDEFVLLLKGCSTDQSCHIAEQIRGAIELRSDVGITASIGVSELYTSLPLEQNKEFADQAAYRAKAEGRNQVVRYDEISR